MLKLTSIALIATIAAAAPLNLVRRQDPTQTGTSKAACETFGEWACDPASGALIQCAYVASHDLTWHDTGAKCTSAVAPLPVPEPTQAVPIPPSQQEVKTKTRGRGKKNRPSKTKTLTPQPQTTVDSEPIPDPIPDVPAPEPQPEEPAPAPIPQPEEPAPPAPIPQPEEPETPAEPAPVPAPQPDTPSQPQQPGSIPTLINESKFNAALTACGINHPSLYPSLVKGFTAPLKDLKELALLIGNTAHESGSYQYTEEIACKGVTYATAECPYGWYHGRGFIQLSWDSNYASAAAALGNPAIHSNPDIVMNDESVNWATVQWYWTSTVQPLLKSQGYTLGNSVKSINGALECGGKRIAEQRVKFIQCFSQQFTGSANDATWC
ncbi:lysozyme-like domain-containing protein [Obelidium mucronatum]|nr:lysozyme-like domain-containing protein [Obelidium mucronatum]